MSRYRQNSQISELIIHCSATPNGRPHTAEDIDRWHGEPGRQFRRDPDALVGAGAWAGKGPHASALQHIGYHYVIRTNGVVEVGRRRSETGAHCRGRNANSIGVCLIGTDRFTAAQWVSLARLVQAEIKAAAVLLAVYGHREFNRRKSCPGFDVRAWQLNGYKPTAEGEIHGL